MAVRTNKATALPYSSAAAQSIPSSIRTCTQIIKMSYPPNYSYPQAPSASSSAPQGDTLKNEHIARSNMHDANARAEFAAGNYAKGITEEAKNIGDRVASVFSSSSSSHTNPDGSVTTQQWSGTGGQGAYAVSSR